MKGYNPAALRPIHRYMPGDLLLEALRPAGDPVPLTPMSQTIVGGVPVTVDDETVESLLNSAKASLKDYPALKDALLFLKFDPAQVNDYFQSIGSMVKIAGGIASLVGAVGTLMSLVDSLLEVKKDQSLQYLEHISQRVDQIYGYLGDQTRRGLRDDRVQWRSKADNVRNACTNARTSRSQMNLDELVRLKSPLDDAIDKMLDPESARIPFWRAVYGYTSYSHWIDAATPPFMSLTDGTPVNYRDPAQELQGTIWDPGHYIDMLLGCLSDRMLLAATTEPAFRATNYDRERLEGMVQKLGTFLVRWAASMIVADPLAGLNNGGQLQHPMYMPPDGIVIGAVDPVSGIAAFEPYWSGFDVVTTWKGSIAAKGVPDETRAKDFIAARAAALDLQPRLFDGVVRMSGLPRFLEFRAHLAKIMAQYTVGSDFVNLPNAWFHRQSLNGPAQQPETVDLGLVGKYSKHPEARDQGHRYWQTGEKTFRFNMALRTDVSLIQLGYSMKLGDITFPLIQYAAAPGDGSNPPRFPTTPLSNEIGADDWLVYDVYQNAVFSDADEDAFEDAEPPKLPRVAAPAGRYVSNPILKRLRPTFVDPPERIFLNERRGSVALQIDVAFEADLNSPEQPFVGQATVTVRNLSPDTCPGGLILPVRVYETRPDLSAPNGTREYLADSMTIHIVPSFLVLPEQYFDDRREGRAKMGQIFSELNDRYAISVSQLVPVGPEWQMRRRAVEEVATDEAIQSFVREQPDLALPVLQRNLAQPNLAERNFAGPHR